MEKKEETTIAIKIHRSQIHNTHITNSQYILSRGVHDVLSWTPDTTSTCIYMYI